MDRKARGLNNYLNGVAAEDCVERHYCEAGAKILKRRWRGKSGEIDLIFQLGTMFIFVEVKKAKDFAAAAFRLSERQMQRIARAAEEFCASTPLGIDADIRIDVALVNDTSESQIIENVSL